METHEILLTIFGASGFWTLLQMALTHVYNKKSETRKELDCIKQSLTTLSESVSAIEMKNAEQDAKTARARILRFNDELLNNVEHSKEAFDDTLAYLDEYDAYCREHPEFVNSRTVAAERNIKKCYQKRMEKHDFIGGAYYEQ